FFVRPVCAVDAPFSLLKLFAAWSEIPRYYPLLNVKIGAGDIETPLGCLMDSLLKNSSKKATQDLAMNTVVLLMSTADEEEDVEEDNEFAFDQAALDDSKPVSFGTKLVLVQLPKLLKYLTSVLPPAESKKTISIKHLEILERVCEHVEDAEVSASLSSTLLAYLERNLIRREEMQINALNAVARLIKVVVDPHSFIPRLVPLLSSIRARPPRDALITIFDSIRQATRLDYVKDSLSLIVKLNSWDQKRLDEPDHDRRIEAYSELNRRFDDGSAIDIHLLEMVAHSDAHEIIETTDLSLRASASANLRKLIEYFKGCELPEGAKTECLQDHLLPLVKKGLRHESEIVRALVALITSFPTHAKLRHLTQLRDTTETDLDFYDNITHIQMHRRQRALRRLTDSLQSKQVSIPIEVLLAFVLPLAQPYLLEVVSKTAALSDEAVRLLGQVLSMAPWKRYLAMLEFYLNKLQREEEKHKAIIRIIVAILDAFHFEVASSSQAKEKGVEKMDVAEQNEENMPLESSEIASGLSQRIYDTMVKQVLPRLQKCIDGKKANMHAHKKSQGAKHYHEDDDILRAPVALAMVKLLLKLPTAILDQHLPGIVLKLCELLKSRSRDVRDSARKTLVAVVDALGPKYLPFVIKELKSTLSKGYQIHVMIFTVHVLISYLAERLKTGDLDACLDEIISVCHTELFSDVTEEKEVQGITKSLHEAKANKTYDTYQFIGRFVGASCLGMVIKPMMETLDAKPSAKTTKKLGDLLRYLAFGLGQNAGIDTPTLLIFAHQTLSEHIERLVTGKRKDIDDTQENDEQLHPQRQQSCFILAKDPGRIGAQPKTAKRSKVHIFVEFGLQVLGIVLKAKRLDIEDDRDVGRYHMQIFSGCS
uniref:Small subunit processome component 20 homolog n=1 Tax=Plectus sambesii TaxID=2011161 RepID=A0A914X119_9BILA